MAIGWYILKVGWYILQTKKVRKVVKLWAWNFKNLIFIEKYMRSRYFIWDKIADFLFGVNIPLPPINYDLSTWLTEVSRYSKG